MKNKLITLLKLAIAAGLILWLIEKGELDFRQLNLLVTMPTIGLFAAFYWLVGPCLLGSLRWLLLLKGAGYNITWYQAFKLQLTGFFFNSAMPGAVGGDLVKVIYVIRGNPDMGKTPAMMSILLDRVIGLGGLFSIGMVLALSAWPTLIAINSLEPLLYGLIGLNLGVLIFFIVALYHYRGDDPFQKLFSINIPGLSVLAKLYNAIRVYRYKRTYFVSCFIISLLIQGMSLALFYFIAINVPTLNSNLNFSAIASIFPIGMLTAALPIAPGGLGVGHVAFDRLFEAVGLSGGANIFNIFTLSQLALNLTGVIAYLSMKKKVGTDLSAGVNSDDATLYSNPQRTTID
jgi:uncharacterized protein (TIRG00374 family)